MEEQTNINEAVITAEMFESRSGRFYISVDREPNLVTLAVMNSENGGTEECVKLKREEVEHLRDFLSNVLWKSQILNETKFT